MWNRGPKRFKRKELNARQRWELIYRDKLKCIQCSAEIALPDPAKPVLPNGSFHHIVPLVYGGLNETSNACLLCRDCHNKVHSGVEEKEKYFAMFQLFIREGRLF